MFGIGTGAALAGRMIQPAPASPVTLNRRSLRNCARIAVAEDDGEMRRLLCHALTVDGYDVLSVGSGRHLVDELMREKAAENPPSLIISDMRMPGRSGMDVAREVRSRGWSIPIILITAFGDEDTKCEAEEAGVTCMFSKPFDLDDLRTAVACLLSRSR